MPPPKKKRTDSADEIKQRSANFIAAEKKEFIRLLQLDEYKVIECKRTDAVTKDKKSKAWADLTNEFNKANVSPKNEIRTVDNLRNLWDNLKRIARKAKGDERAEIFQTGMSVTVECDMPSGFYEHQEPKEEGNILEGPKYEGNILEGPSEITRDAVLKASEPLPESTPTVEGYDFNKGVDYSALFKTYKNSGFQATSLGLAIEEVNRMLDCRERPLSPSHCDVIEEDPFIRRKSNCTIFLGYTSNMVSCGIRDTIRFLVEHKMVDCIVTTAGGVEEDLIKCLANTYVGDFHLDGRTLRDKAINRIGNLLVPNENYCKFEDWVMPKLDTLLQEQRKEGKIWSPSTIIARLGAEINDPTSILYWASKNAIPIFCPALTDGSLGDMMYFHSYRSPGLIVDILQDLKRLNKMAVRASNTGMIIVGGGVVKHHICNANLMRNGADFSVFINTASEFDGSDAGARPDEAISWGKIRKTARPVKVYAEASLVFPILVGETFASRHFAHEKN